MSVATFDQNPVGAVFVEDDTGEYYIKKSEKSACVYVVDEDHEFLDRDGQPMQCEFPPNHQVEDF